MSVSDHKYVSIWSLPQQGREWIIVLLLRLPMEEICGLQTSLEKFCFQACFKRGTLKWKDGRILAESCIEQGSAVRRSCICHFSCNRENGDEGTEKRRRAARRAQLFRTLKPKTYWQKVNGRLQTWLKAVLDIINTKRRVKECNGILVRLMGGTTRQEQSVMCNKTQLKKGEKLP